VGLIPTFITCKYGFTILFYPHGPPNDIFSDTAYGLTNTNMDRVLYYHDELRRLVHVWPPHGQLNTVGSKWQLVQNLDIIAARYTNSARPYSALLDHGCVIPNDIVLKRTHSDTGRHVILPGCNDRTWAYMDAHSEIPGCRWFGQTYVDTLYRLGEWRVFIIGGKAVYTVHTVYDDTRQTWRWDIVRDFHSLEHLA
jgi:hypothetical protein